jgi:hypothetical protein
VQAKAKQKSINASKTAFFCFLLFFRISTFQWVMADSNKKIRADLQPHAEMRQTHA